ncbi:hypothetical protein BN14_05586 [Rhizoctonia solani AG-1 IB]|uniref:Uncharacterized protein n=2 Tax=Thanatephorus cucumeris (strain AG1-IB / isolate 7/3/14) TaxID=1108050 RepID=M5BWJ6_THACB|nr:hypothetical protein BN14_05586 [Rhizoctonia solani AG-1 IB]
MLEFAIENIQVVKRRNERTDAIKSGNPGTAHASKKRKAPDSTGDDPEQSPKKGRPTSKQPAPRKAGGNSKTKDMSSPKKATPKPTPKSVEAGNIGGIIGRKRRDKRKPKGN